jgi:AcrR family transcriptional regulator
MKTDEKILKAAQELLASGGFNAASFDAIGRALGISKQAVLYWYPSRQELFAALLVSWLAAEADVAVASLEGTDTPEAAIAAFVENIAAFHLGDLNRFRMMYLASQTSKTGMQERPGGDVLESVHAMTDRMYIALAESLEGDLAGARKHAVAIHSAVLGLVLMFGLADSIKDPLKHSEADLIAALVARLTASD